jgi:hypothetical protein
VKRARVKATLRAYGGRRVVIEGVGTKRPRTFIAVAGGEKPEGAWLSAGELRRLANTARRILK